MANIQSSILSALGSATGLALLVTQTPKWRQSQQNKLDDKDYKALDKKRDALDENIPEEARVAADLKTKQEELMKRNPEILFKYGPSYYADQHALELETAQRALAERMQKSQDMQIAKEPPMPNIKDSRDLNSMVESLRSRANTLREQTENMKALRERINSVKKGVTNNGRKN